MEIETYLTLAWIGRTIQVIAHYAHRIENFRRFCLWTKVNCIKDLKVCFTHRITLTL